MSYCADGYGKATLKENVNTEALKNLLDNKLGEMGADGFLEFNISGCKITLSDGERYCEEDTIEFLNLLIPYVTEGKIVYTDEDGYVWRFVFYPNTKKWLEEKATIDFNFESYTDEELIAELRKRGYTVVE